VDSRPKFFYWIAGAAVALLGVAVARLLSPRLPVSYQDVTFFIGIAIAIAGIFLAAGGAGSTSRSSDSPNDENKPL
jgi:hypothetical protein